MVGTASVAAGQPPASEKLRYRWKLGGLSGALAGLFFPNRGDGALTTAPGEGGRLDSRLTITSTKSRQGEFFTYGSLIDSGPPRTVFAWSDYLWRGRQRYRESDLEDEQVLDIVSGIYALRRDPPTEPRRMRIWSDGKIYPVEVLPLDRERRTVGGRPVEVREYSIRGLKEPGSRHWKGRLDIWLADDEAATPVELNVVRSLAKVRLVLVESNGE